MSSLENGLRILALLSPQRPVLRVGEVCRELDIPKSSVSRLMKALGDHGLLEKGGDEAGYVVGRRALVLSDLYLARHSLLGSIETAVAELVAEFGFVGYIGAPAGRDIVILRRKHGSYPLRLVQEVGQRLSPHLTAIGRALVARRPQAQAVATLTGGGMPESDALEALSEIRRSGVARVTSAIIPGISAIGAAVADPARGEVMGFSLSFPLSAADERLRARMAARVREEARAIGLRLGDAFWIEHLDERIEPAAAPHGGVANGTSVGP